jgi:methylmalonyl-CoA/ethylmalonyl-CoA epimerase
LRHELRDNKPIFVPTFDGIMARKVSHVGIAVTDLEAAKRTFGALLGVSNFHQERVEDQKVSIASCEVGESRIELTQAIAEDSPIAKFIAKRGEGIHHLAFEVDDVDAEMARLQSEGYQFTASAPSNGAHGMRIVFLHPKATNGVLIELCETRE